MSILNTAQSAGNAQDDQASLARTIAARYKIVNDTSPWLAQNPDLIRAMAEDPNVDTPTLASNSASVAGMINMDALHSRLGELDAPTQRALYSQLTSTQQQALGSMGYQPPERQVAANNQVDGFFGDVGSFVGGTIGALGSGIKRGVGDILHVANVVGSEPAHLYRTIRTMDVDTQMKAFGGALLAGVGIAAGIALAPETGGLSLLGSFGESGLLASAGATGLGGLTAGTAIAAATNPTDWWDSYNSTYDGERTFTSSSQSEANRILGGNSTIVNLAKDLAYDGGVQELAKDFAGTADSTDPNVILGSVQRVVGKMMSPTDPRYKATLDKMATIATTDTFQEAVAALQNGKISFGRDLARAVNLTPGTKLYNVVSGGADGLWTVTMDPLLAAGALGEWNKVRRFSVPILDGEEYMKFVTNLSDTNGAVRRAHTIMADAVERGDFGVVKRLMPESQTMWSDLLDHKLEYQAEHGGPYDRQALLDFFSSGAGKEALLSGKSVVKGRNAVMLANTSLTGAQWGKLKDYIGTTINMADSNNSSNITRKLIQDVDPEAYDAVAKLRLTQESATPQAVLGDSGLGYRWESDPLLSSRYKNTKAVVDFLDRIPVLGTLERQMGALLGTATHMLPETNMIVTDSGKAFTGIKTSNALGIDKFVDLGRVTGVRSDTAELWRSFILSQTNQAARDSAIESYIGTMLDIGGMTTTPAGRDMAEQFINKYHQTFSLGGSDTLTIAGRERRIGVLPVADQASAIAIPDLKELRQAAQKGTFMKYFFNAGDGEMIDHAMTRIWKPAVILRLGFIPRAAGEELLAFVAREGFGAYVNQFAARSVAQGQLADANTAGDGKLLELLADSVGENGAYVTPQLRARIEQFQTMTHLRPLESMMARNNYTRPGINMLHTWSDWVRGALESGALPDSMQEWIPDRLRNIVLGKDNSLRRLLLTGTDDMAVRAMHGFESGFAKPLLDATTSSGAGIFDAGERMKGVTEIAMQNPETGQLTKQQMIPNKGVFHWLDPDSSYYTQGYHTTVRHLTSDPVVSEALSGVLPRVLPNGLTTDAAEALHARYLATQETPLKDAVDLALSGRDLDANHVDALLRKAKASMTADQYKRLKMWMPEHGGSPEKIINAFRQVSGDAATNDALGLVGDLNELTAPQRGWAQLFLPHRPTVDPSQDYWLNASQASEQINDRLRRIQLDPSMQDFFKGSQHNLVGPDETPVANILDRTRTYMPAMHPDNASKLTAALAADPGIRAAAQAGMSMEDAVAEALKAKYRTAPDLMYRDADSFAKADKWIDEFAARHFGKDGNTFDQYVADATAGIPDRNVVLAGDFALTDPRVASDLTRTLQAYVGGRGIQNGSGAAFTEIGANEAGRYIKDPLVANGRAELVPTGNPYITLPDGSTVHGITAEESVAQWAPTIQERINQVGKEDVQTALVARDPERVFRRVSDGQGHVKYVTVRPDETLSKNSEYFYKTLDERGRLATAAGLDKTKSEMHAIQWGDSRFMNPGQYTNGDGWLFDQLGPALRDYKDEIAGRSFRTSDNLRVYHYGLDDVGNATGHLPGMIYAQAYSPPREATKWEKVVETGFNKVINPSIDAIVRKPMAAHNYIQSYAQNSRAYGHLIDRELIDTTIPATFAKVRDATLTASQRRDELVGAARSNAKYFDHPEIGKADDSTVMSYLNSLTTDDVHKVAMRALDAGEEGRNYDGLVSMLDVKRAGPNTFKYGVDGVDKNLEFTRDLIAKMGSHLGVDTWDAARQNEKVQEILKATPGLDRAMFQGGFDQLKAAKVNLDHFDQRIHEMSMERAIVNTVPFLDSHNVKSQFSEYGKSMMPFWYAEENFFKRWGHTLLLDPAAIRKGQLTMMGMKSVGIVRTDANGKDWFVYPGSGVLTDVLQRLPFLGAVPFATAFRTQPSQLLPGFSQNVGTPSFSPLVTFPLAVATSMFPELNSLQSAVIGKQNMNRGIARQFIPTQLQNFWDAATADDSNTKFASAMMSAAQMLEANGKGLKPDATATDLENYVDTLRASARTILVAQALTGFVSPGSPSLTLDDDKATGLSKEYYDLIRYQGVEQGSATFIAEHGAKGPSYLANPEITGKGDLVNPLSYGVGRSESVSGAPLPATKQAVQFYQDNADWLHQQPLAGAWLLPPDQTGGADDSPDAYNQQTLDDLRVRRTPEEFIRAMRYKNGATAYFNARSAYNLAVKQADLQGDRGMRANADLTWQQFSDSYKALHPVFAEELGNGDGKTKRQAALAQLRTAINDPEAPQPWHIDAVKKVISEYTQYQATLSDLSQSRAASAKDAIDRLKTGFAAAMDAYVFNHPEVSALWESLIKPDAQLS